jgi:hypothetical protein
VLGERIGAKVEIVGEPDGLRVNNAILLLTLT